MTCFFRKLFDRLKKIMVIAHQLASVSDPRHKARAQNFL